MDLAKLAEEIAVALGEDYYVDSKSDGIYNDKTKLIRNRKEDKSFAIQIYHSSREKRISVGGKFATAIDKTEFPYASHDSPKLSIEVADHRDGKSIAKDITRRFLPWYCKRFGEGLPLSDNHNACLEKQQKNLAMFAKILGGTIKNEMVDVPFMNMKTRGYISKFQVSHSTVQIELRSVPIAIAEKLMKCWVDEV